MKNIILCIIALLAFSPVQSATQVTRAAGSEKILGKWISSKKDLIVEIYKCGQEFRGRVVWFDNKEEPGLTPSAETDSNNPDPLLRGRNIRSSGVNFSPLQSGYRQLG